MECPRSAVPESASKLAAGTVWDLAVEFRYLLSQARCLLYTSSALLVAAEGLRPSHESCVSRVIVPSVRLLGSITADLGPRVRLGRLLDRPARWLNPRICERDTVALFDRKWEPTGWCCGYVGIGIPKHVFALQLVSSRRGMRDKCSGTAMLATRPNVMGFKQQSRVSSASIAMRAGWGHCPGHLELS